MTFCKKGDAFRRSARRFAWMYYRDLPLFVLVDNLPQSRYEIPPSYLSIAGFVGRDRHRFHIGMCRACARSDHRQVCCIEREEGTPDRYTPESWFRPSRSWAEADPERDFDQLG